jgi:hypothetical protein
MPNGMRGQLTAVAVLRSGRVWAAGDDGQGGMLLLRWVGSTWKQVTVPVTGVTNVRGIAAFPRRIVYAIGDRRQGPPFLLRGHRGQWGMLDVPRAHHDDALAGIAGTDAQHVWIAAAVRDRATVYRWRAGRLRIVLRTPGPSAFTDVAVIRRTHVWAVGATGFEARADPFAFHRSDSGWVRDRAPMIASTASGWETTAGAADHLWAVTNDYDGGPNAYVADRC